MSEIDLGPLIKAKSDQLNALDIVGEMTLKITGASVVEDSDQPLLIDYEGGKGRPWKPSKGMRSVLAQCWGKRVNMDGRRVVVVCDPSVTWAGQEVGGIRIVAVSDIKKDKTTKLRLNKHKVIPYKVRALPDVSDPTIDAAALKAAGEVSAGNGPDAYKEWYMSLTNDERAAVAGVHEELKAKSQEVDDGDDTPIF